MREQSREEAHAHVVCTMLRGTQREYFSGAQRNRILLLWSVEKEPTSLSPMPSLVSQQTSLLLQKGGGVWRCGLNGVL